MHEQRRILFIEEKRQEWGEYRGFYNNNKVKEIIFVSQIRENVVMQNKIDCFFTLPAAHRGALSAVVY